MEAITPKQRQVYEFMNTFERERGFAPSQQEIATHFGFKSLGTVQDYLNRLSRAGYIARPKYGTRAARAIGAEVERGAVRERGSPSPALREPSAALSGDLVLVRLAGRLAIRRLFRQRGRTELHPIDADPSPVEVNPEFTLLAVLTGFEGGEGLGE